MANPITLPAHDSTAFQLPGAVRSQTRSAAGPSLTTIATSLVAGLVLGGLTACALMLAQHPRSAPSVHASP